MAREVSKPRTVIIEIDLGISIDSIIDDSVTAITSENRSQIDEAIKEATAKQEMATAAKKAKEESESAKEAKMRQLYESLALASANAGYLPAAEILAVSAPDMPNMISFVGRMRNWLKANGIEAKLTQVKRGGSSGYRLEAGDKEDGATTQAP